MRLKVSTDIEKPIEKRPSSSLVAAHDVIAACLRSAGGRLRREGTNCLRAWSGDL